MSGLIDSDTGLAFGEGLQFQNEIGTASFVIGPEGTTEMELFWESQLLTWGDLDLIWGE